MNEKNVCALLCLLYAALPAPSRSQTLDDFRTAASSDGVNLIPFPDLRRDATAIAGEVDRRKAESESFNYKTLESRKNNMLKEIKKTKDEIESINKDIDDMKKKYAEVSVTSLEDDIKKRKQTIEDYNAKIKDLNGEMAKAADVFERLYNARAGLREYFDKALSQLSDARSNPSRHLGSSPSEDDIKRFEDYTKVIENEIQSRVRTHREQEDGAKQTQKDYEALISKAE